MGQIVRVENLVFAYRDGIQNALNGINFSIEKGSVIGITGPAGAGKSTLLSCINGVIPHHTTGDLKGQVVVKGQAVQDRTFSQLAHDVGTVFEDVDFQTVSITVEEEIAFGPENLGVNPETIGRRIISALESTAISALRNRAISTLSGGQKQRVAISAVLSMLPELLLLDEPSSELDPLGTREVFQAIYRLNKDHGITVVIVSQKVDQLVDCDRLMVISEGRIILDDTPRNVFYHRDLLTPLGVMVPSVTEFTLSLCDKLGRSMSADDIPLTVDEAERILNDVFHECRILS